MSLPEGKNENHVQSKPQQNKIPTNNRNTSKCWSKPLFLSLLQKHTQSASCTPKLQSSIAFQNMSGFSCRLLATAPWLLWEQASLWRAKAGRWSRWRINKYFFLTNIKRTTVFVNGGTWAGTSTKDFTGTGMGWHRKAKHMDLEKV